MKDVRVLIVDDQPWVRFGLAKLLDLEEGVEVVADLESGEAALAWLEAGQADVLLMDVRMPGLGGVGATREVRARGGPPVVLLTTFEDDEDMIAGLRAGAAGYVLKDVSVEALRDALLRVARGERYVQPRVADVLVGALLRERAQEDLPPEPLTPRELEVLTLLARGWTNKRVAQALNLGEGTVKIHVSNVLSKLGARDRVEAVGVARARGLLPEVR